ncbi:LuxR C-terminal-related transcriptional regulator [Plantactinospora sp. WMMB334]|uniref:helix-turn-helix transcriptional regulator n=1 Tax=Plantactinospora sp. WMMB334 TaxID=3404119 RepID=UPI003B9491F5
MPGDVVTASERLWRPDWLDLLEEGLRRARAGTPTVVCVSGTAGVGKTSLLDELVGRAGDFIVLTAEGLEDFQLPFGVLSQWTAAPPGEYEDDADPFAAAQVLRKVLDQAGRRPVLLRLDDLHWADAESVASLLWLLRRSVGDRLLVGVGTRPLSGDQHPAWQRWLGGRQQEIRIELTGLTQEQVAVLVNARDPAVATGLATLLWEHTSGNPLFVLALLAEYEPAELATRMVLPAPAEFARTVAVRVARLEPAAAALLGAVVVLGGAWHPLVDAAAVAELAEPVGAAQQLSDAGLVQLRVEQTGDSLRPAHSLIRSAVYQQLSLVERKRLHGRAGSVLLDESQVLDHRLAAVTGHDDNLAAALDTYAQQLRARRSWRASARYLRAAATVTATPDLRRRRWLESLFDTATVSDLSAVRAELSARPASDEPAETVLRGLLDLGDGRFGDAIDRFGAVLALPAGTVDAIIAYRAGVLLAAAMYQRGDPPREVDEVLRAAERHQVVDPCVVFHARHIRTFTDRELLTCGEQWATIDPALGAARSVPVDATLELLPRAILAVAVGFYDVARDDLAEVMRRSREGIVSLPDARIPDGLGYVQWLLGDWTAARICLHLAHEMRGMSLYLPYLLVSEGRFAEADSIIDKLLPAMEARDRWTGWDNSLHLWVTRAHAAGDQAMMRDIGQRLLHRVQARLGLTPSPVSVRLRVSAGLATLWADRPDLTLAYADQVAHARPTPPWAASCAAWLRGLAAEANGDHPAALALLGAAIADRAANLPLYRAHMFADHARLALAVGDGTLSRRSAQDARTAYERLGATAYLDRIPTATDGSPGMRRGGEPAGPAPRRIGLTDRERDVLALVSNGMSYAQIAAELFITSKTVGYHLSNLYAKAGVANRHQLAELARRAPAAFDVVN